MTLLHLKILLIASIVFVSFPIYCQIEDPELVDKIIKEGNLGELYDEFPNAMNLYKESRSLKIKGVLLETMGIGMTVTGGYVIYKGLFLKAPDKKSGIDIGLPDFTNVGKLGLITAGSIIGLVGIVITRSGSHKIDLSKKIRCGSAQQYIWDLKSSTAIKKKQQNLGVLSIGLNERGLGLVYVF